LKGVHLTLLMGPVVAVPVPKEVIDALQSVQVTTSVGARSGFQLTFSMGKNSNFEKVLIPAGFFDPMIRVIIIVTLNGTPNVIMDGVITRQQVTASNEAGKSTFAVTGEDVSAAMDLIDFSGIPYPAMPAEARVALCIAKYAMFGIIPMVIPSILINVPIPVKEIPKHQGTDLAYINSLANEVGYVFYVEPGPVPGTNIGYWGPEIKVGVPQRALTINMDGQTNTDSMSFTYDGLAKTLYILFIQELISKAPIPIPIPDITPLNPPLGIKPPLPLHVKFITNEPDQNGTAKYSPIQAALIGLAKASKGSDVISGTGSLDVLRYGGVLQPRKLVGVRGAGIAYDGYYYVKSVTHNIKHGEYKQSFALSRNALVPSTGSVAV
ncbi:MAG TPA: hypothetical protein VM656_14755, partial [Pyrinomonadaceae bacterium]|nr:hypothetical protein [Pyrinomonadaceae bacterium]